MRCLLYGLLAGLAVTTADAAEQVRSDARAKAFEEPARYQAAPGYCVNVQADFYEYSGGTCRSGYRLGPGNCWLSDGQFRAVSPAACRNLGGLVALPGDPVLTPGNVSQPQSR